MPVFCPNGIRLWLVTLASHRGAGFMHCRCSTFSLVLCWYLGKAVEDSPSVWTPATHLGDPEASGFSLPLLCLLYPPGE